MVHFKADPSRGVILKELPSASFREWLNIKKGFDVPMYSLKEVLSRAFDLT